tara:strand:- start:3084 stop:4301 length:1218 start_codon:yes stop_codon:yes gene_type:complete
MNNIIHTDICIIGAGMVGLSLANQISERYPNLSITIIEKEKKIGKHTSGRNSGVLHAGIYYEPGSIKAKVCVEGARRLKNWCKENNISILECGKVITPQKIELDNQIDKLYKRGILNGAKVEIIDENQFNSIAPDGFTSSGRALWSPATSVVNPMEVINKLKDILSKKGVKFIFFEQDWTKSKNNKKINLSNKAYLNYDFLFNCAGLYSDKVAKRFGVGKEFTMLPFKGSYWELKENTPLNLSTNLYPVPDLEFPFLGVHATPGFGGKIYLGPTATPAFGRENYYGLRNLDMNTSLSFAFHMTSQFFISKKMRNYIFNQAFEWLPHKFIDAARLILPKVKLDYIKKSPKVGIRPQLYDLTNKTLVEDFLIIETEGSSHIINAISPAFTASFAFADRIIDNCSYFK